MDRTTPALDYVVRDEHSSYGPGFGCAHCPFNGDTPTNNIGKPIPRWEVQNDPEESYYKCSLLNGHITWGESPSCSEGDWRKRARQELQELCLQNTPREKL